VPREAIITLTNKSTIHGRIIKIEDGICTVLVGKKGLMMIPADEIEQMRYMTPKKSGGHVHARLPSAKDAADGHSAAVKHMC